MGKNDSSTGLWWRACPEMEVGVRGRGARGRWSLGWRVSPLTPVRVGRRIPDRSCTFFFYNKFISLWCRKFCGGTRRGKCLLSSSAPCHRPEAPLLSPQFQSHQIFHVLVVAAAFVHFYGVSNLQEFRHGLEGGCTDDSLL